MNAPPGLLCRAVSRWLLQLSQITMQGAEPLDADRLSLYSDLLARDFPESAFSREALHAASTGNKYFPPYDVIREAIASVQPAGQLAIASQVPGLNRIDLSWVDFFDKAMAEGPSGRPFARAAACRLSVPDAYRAHLLSLVASQSQAAYRHITQTGAMGQAA